MGIDLQQRREIDEEFFGFVDDGPGRFHLTATPMLCRPDRMLYGGAAIGMAFAATERATGDPCIWQTTQFVGSTEVGTRIDLAVDVVAGRRTRQVQVTGSVDGRVIFTSLGAAAPPDPEGISGLATTAPGVPAPDVCPLAAFARPENGWFMGLEGRVALEDDDDTNTRVWSRFTDGLPLTSGRLAFIADIVPMGVARAVGRPAVGLSLDNTLRVGQLRDDDPWVLIEVRAQQAYGGFGHGAVLLWTRDGHLLASGSQTARMTAVEFDALCRVPGTGGNRGEG